ncbi:MAG: hypothetical protein IT174_06230 [Acidobacteria bacterium]|nr:hypothetical protein [Acidobacteriota bacterium]
MLAAVRDYIIGKAANAAARECGAAQAKFMGRFGIGTAVRRILAETCGPAAHDGHRRLGNFPLG